MIVFFTDEALADLENIGDYIARGNPGRALSFVVELIERCEQLADKPHSFTLVWGYEHLGVRRCPHGRYLIFYRPQADKIAVLHILNASRDHEAVLSGEI